MLFNLLNKLSLQQQSLVVAILWSLWKNRNKKALGRHKQLLIIHRYTSKAYN